MDLLIGVWFVSGSVIVFFEGGCRPACTGTGSRVLSTSLPVPQIFLFLGDSKKQFPRFVPLPSFPNTVANSISFMLFQLRPSLSVTRSFRPGCPLALDLLFALG